MNRRAHLLATAPRVADWPHHLEHLIVDWSSAEPLRREELPADPRLRLLRVEGEPRWNLCRAYNFAVAQCRGERVLKLDADAWPTAAMDPHRPGLRLAALDAAGEAGWLCAFGSGPEGRKGQFLIDRALFEAVGGFNELLVGYGFDDKDLLGRLWQRTGQAAQTLPVDWIGVIPHSDGERAEQVVSRGGLAASHGLAAMRATRLANRLLAAHCPWGARAEGSRYREEAPGVWRLVPGSLPSPPPRVAAEADHARRMTFWGHFLAIPEVWLDVLPFSLFPPARGGRWPVRWWHRLWWHTGRRALALPVWLLVEGRRWLAGERGRPSGSRPLGDGR
ncbi:MAG: glycosyltransferase family A protein [Cyanobacteriota bacterium]|nr:glycosyltransferase family A protein [Cyanobacteriota bacterium]